MPFFQVLIYLSLNCLAPYNSLSLFTAGGDALQEPIVVGQFLEEGEASFYGEGFHGRPTANTEIYDMNKLTAAHPTLPFNTILEVENLANSRRVLVRINDRGPFIKNRVIDLSVAAARRLDMIETGIARVRLTILKKFVPETVGDYLLLKSFILQFGAFGDKRNAEKLLDRVQSFFSELSFRVIYEDRLFKVVTAKEFSEEELEAIRDKLRKSRIDFFVRKPWKQES